MYDEPRYRRMEPAPAFEGGASVRSLPRESVPRMKGTTAATTSARSGETTAEDERADRADRNPYVVDMALRHNIRVISWTYNDPVVWHEFVIDTARLAQKLVKAAADKQDGLIAEMRDAKGIAYTEALAAAIQQLDEEARKRARKVRIDSSRVQIAARAGPGAGGGHVDSGPVFRTAAQPAPIKPTSAIATMRARRGGFTAAARARCLCARSRRRTA